MRRRDGRMRRRRDERQRNNQPAATQQPAGATRQRKCGAVRRRREDKTAARQEDAQVAQREDKSAAQRGDNHGKTPLDYELDQLLERYVHPSSPSPTLYSFSSPLLPVNAVSSQFYFSWQPKRFAPSASASRHAPLRRKCLVESLGTTCGSSSIGLEALCPQSHCKHHLQDVVFLDDRSNEDILVSCGMRKTAWLSKSTCTLNPSTFFLRFL